MSDTKSKLEQDLLILAMTVVPKIEYLDLKERHERVSQMLEIAEKALEFYANRSAWVKKQNNLDPTFCRSDNEYDKSLGFYFGGKTAREALAKIKESK